MSATTNSFLVVRLGKIYDQTKKSYLAEDPITEINRVLEEQASCFFGKFGKKLNDERLQELIGLNRLYLLIAYKTGNQYVSQTYKVVSIPTPDKVTPDKFPPYYTSHERYISTWLEVEKSVPQPKLSDLVVRSSGEKLLTSMTLSSSSFFFCRLI
jgi:hypothetical protein